MTAREVLERIHDAGGSVVAEGDKLKFRAPGPLPADVMSLAKEHKSELLSLLSGSQEEMTVDRMRYMLNLLASRRRNIVKRTGLPPRIREKAPTEWRFDYSGPVPKLVPLHILP